MKLGQNQAICWHVGIWQTRVLQHSGQYDPLNIDPFGNTHEVSEVPLKILMGDFRN